MRSCSFTIVDLWLPGGFFFLKVKSLINIRVTRTNKTVIQFENGLSFLKF